MAGEAEIRAYHLGAQGARRLELGASGLPVADSDADADAEDDGFVWVHVNSSNTPEAAEAFLNASGLDAQVLSALLAPETRPRCTLHHDGVLMNLRGVNLSPGSEPEDMVSLRMWVTGRLVVTHQKRPLFAVRDVFDAIAGRRPSLRANWWRASRCASPTGPSRWLPS